MTLHYNLDTSYWSALAPVAMEKRTHGPYTIWWLTRESKQVSSWSSWRMQTNYLVVDPGVGSVKEYENWRSALKDIPGLEVALETSFAEAEKIHKKNLAKARKEKNETEAKELGISVKELIEKRKQDRLARKEVKVIEHTAEQLNLLAKVGGQLKRLVEDVEALEQVIQSDPSKLNIHSADNYIRHIRKARNVLRVWARRKRVSLYDLTD